MNWKSTKFWFVVLLSLLATLVQIRLQSAETMKAYYIFLAVLGLGHGAINISEKLIKSLSELITAWRK